MQHKLLPFLGFGAMIVSQFVLFLTFVLAYTTPDKSVMIYINNHGEANIELILLIFLTFVTTPYCIYWYLIKH